MLVRNFYFLTFLIFLGGLGDFLSVSALGYLIYMKSGLGASGLILSIPLITGCLISLFVGNFSDKYLKTSKRIKSFLQLNTIFLFAIALSLAFSNYHLILFFLILKEIFYYSYKTCFNSLMPELVEQRNLEKKLGIFSTLDLFSKGIGLTLGPILASYIGFHVLLIDASIWIIACGVYLFISIPTSQNKSEHKNEIKTINNSYLDYFKKFHGMYLIVFLFWITMNILWGSREVLGISIIHEVFQLPNNYVGAYNFVSEIGGSFAGVVLSLSLFMHGRSIQFRLYVALIYFAFGIVGVHIYHVLLSTPNLIFSMPIGFVLKFAEGFSSTIAGILCMKYLVYDLDIKNRGKASAVVVAGGVGILALSKSVVGYISEYIGSSSKVYFALGVGAVLIMGAVLLVNSYCLKEVKN